MYLWHKADLHIILEPPSKIRRGILASCGSLGEFGISRRFGTNRIADLGVSHG